MKKVLLLFLIFVSLDAIAQENPFEYEEEHTVLLRKEFEAGAIVHSSGWGLIFRRGKNTTVSRKKMFEIEAIGMKHPKEYKTISYLSDKPKSFVYGKLNSFLILHGGYSQQFVLFDKTDNINFEIRLNATAGVSIGITKPVYFYVLDNTDNNTLKVEKFREDNSYQAVEEIYGRAEFTRGLDEIKFHPGIYARVGTTFEYAPLRSGVKAIEAGIMVDAYTKTIPLMAFSKNKQVFFNFYLTFMLGKKW